MVYSTLILKQKAGTHIQGLRSINKDAKKTLSFLTHLINVIVDLRYILSWFLFLLYLLIWYDIVSYDMILYHVIWHC